jgi:tRNA (guanine37-N1)-methyltransferase
VFICGHYEGIDERALEKIGAESFSIGDYVLTGGELPALVMIDAVSRLCPGVLGNDESSETESFSGDLLEYPQYTRPDTWEGMSVPEVLLTGNPKEVNAWRLEKSKEITKKVRPDLYEKYEKRCEILDKLLKDKRNNIQMIEQLRRGTGEIVSEKPLLIADFRAKVAFLEYDAVLTPDELKDILPDSLRSVVVGEKCLESIEGDERFEPSCRIVNCVYTEKVHRRVVNKDIRLLDMSACDYVGEHYELGGPEYAKERIAAGAM